MTKFGVPFSGAADETIGGRDAARKGDAFPSDQVDESRKGAMRGAAKFSKDVDCDSMQTTMKATDGFSIMKKMENY